MRVSIIALLLCLCWSAFANDHVSLSAEPSWLRPVQADLVKTPVLKNISNGYYLELYDQQVNLRANTRYIHATRNIVNETGVQNASEVSVHFSPQYQEVIFHRVSVIRDGKIIHTLKEQQIRVLDEEAEASEFLYYGQKRAFVILKDVRKDDRIDFSYSVVGFNPVYQNKYSDKIYFTSATAICNYFETIIVPKNRKLHFRTFNGASAPQTELKGDQSVHYWSNPTTSIWESSSDAPSWYDSHPYVSITEYNSWQEVVAWGLGLFDHYNHKLPTALEAKMAEWRAIAKGDKDKFAVLAIRYVQDQVRYLGLEVGENTHKPHAPEEVFAHKYGDCKDKSLLLVMILQSEKIPAFVAMLSTTKHQAMADEPPGPDEFDHAIVAIQRSTGYIYVDPTIANQGGELNNLYLPPYNYALVIRDGETKLQPVKEAAIAETQIEEKLTVGVLDSARLEVRSTYRGGKADDIRASLSGMSTSELEDSYTQYYEKSFEGIQLAKTIVIDDDSVRNELIVKELYTIPELWSVNAEGNQAFEIFAKAIYDIIPDADGISKKSPKAIPFPLSTHYSLTVVMHDNWDFPLSELHIKNNSYQFDYVPKIKGNVITLDYVYKTFKDNIPANELVQYKADYKKIIKKLSFELFQANPSAPSTSPSGGGTNWIAIWFSFGLIMALSFLFRYLDRQTLGFGDEEKQGWPIASWLVLLGISLVLGGIVQIVSIVDNNYFDRSAWLAVADTGGTTLQSVVMVELTFDLIGLTGAVACFYWFLKRRDIFPKMFIGYIGSVLAGEIILLVLYTLVPYPSSYGDLASMTGAQLLRTFIYASIWVTYIARSERARNTFVRT